MQRRRTGAIRRVVAVAFIGGMGGGLVFPIIPAVGLALGIPAAMIGLILAANRITRLALASWAGRLVDRLGGRGPLALGLLLEGVGILGYSAALAFGHPTAWFLAGRAMFGAGSALLQIGAQATVLRLSLSSDRGRQAAAVRVALSLGMPGGLVLGGLIADVVSNRAAFLVGAALEGAGAIAALILVPASAGPEQPADALRPRIDSSWHWLSNLRREPEFPFVAAACGFNLLCFLALQGVLMPTLVLLVLHRQFAIFGLAAEGTAGLLMAAIMTVSLPAALALGRLLDQRQLRTPLIVPALGGLALGLASLAFGRTLPAILPGLILLGTFFNGVTLPLLSLLGDITPRERLGRVVSLFQLSGDIGGSIGPVAGLTVGVGVGLAPTYLGAALLLATAMPFARALARSERTFRS